MPTKLYPTRQLGRNGPTVSAIGYGTMGIGVWYGTPRTDAEAQELLTTALNRGQNLWDTSDCYGTAEKAIGKWFSANPARRSEVFLCSKFGACNFTKTLVDDFVPDSDPRYVKMALYRSLYLLQTDYIDLYYQHRVDPKVPVEVVMEALRDPLERGLIRWIGLSECSAADMRRAKAVPGVGDRIIATQVEFSPFSLDIRDNGIAETTKELGLAVVAYAPLGRGLFSGQFRSRADFQEGDCRLFLPRWTEENFPKNLVLVDQMKEIADRLNIKVGQLTLAWILAQDPNWIPIPGGLCVEHVLENADAAEIKLAPEDIQLVNELVEQAARTVSGTRYPEELLYTLYADSPPLSGWKGSKE
ncbi:hypothetical protein NLJ89_g6832 [Agrocybe chaxingu]|uniref:NADP-dependent oxidoreductase domain-containing protein n=1 Tax=Agrocybe chaxingu TaxID=84603 RepID=A0A9W8JVQ2_9AGAR|nr:hypothetical protein NLJ89_g6832 [Agrocybe chaxingu]